MCQMHEKCRACGDQSIKNILQDLYTYCYHIYSTHCVWSSQVQSSGGETCKFYQILIILVIVHSKRK